MSLRVSSSILLAIKDDKILAENNKYYYISKGLGTWTTLWFELKGMFNH